VKPSQHRPQQQPRHSFNVASFDLMAADLAGDMLSFLVNMYEQASTDSERLDIILRYGSVMQQLQQTIGKAARRQRRSYPGHVETK